MLERPLRARGEKAVSQFLDAAEKQFAKKGYDGARIRAIAADAGAQLGALHYYWGSKEALFAAVAERRLRPANEERIRRLDLCLASGKTAPLREILLAYIEPMAKASVNNPVFDELILRTLTDPAPEVRSVFENIFDETTFRFIRLLRNCCEDLDDQTFYWRVGAAIGAIQQFLTNRGNLKRLSQGRFAPTDIDRGVAELVDSLDIMMSAPLRHSRSPSKRLDNKRRQPSPPG